MAQLKDTTIQGSARVTDTLYSNAVQAKIFNIPTASNGTTYGPGTNGQVLKSNGASVYWASDSNSDINVKQLAAITTSGAYPIILANSTATTEVTGTVNKSANLTYNPSTKALSTGGTINGLTFTAASTGFTIAGGTTSKTLTVSNTYTLGAACAKGVTDNSSNADVTSSDTNLITGRTLYYQLAKKGYTTNTGTVTSVTLTSGSGITVSDSGTAITSSGSRTISITGMNTSSGSTSKCLTEKGTWASFSNNSGTVTSVTLTSGAGITVSDSGTAITGSGSRTISITGVDTSSGSTTQCLTKKGTWASFTNNAGTVTSVQVAASDPLQSSTGTASSTTLSTTISFKNQSPNKVLAGPSSGSSAAAPTFRSLVAADIPNLSWNKITSDKPTTLSGYGITDAAASGHTQAVNKGGTNITSYAVGDILYASGTTTLSKLAGNTTTTQKFLAMTGTGSAGAAPSWSELPKDILVVQLTKSGNNYISNDYTGVQLATAFNNGKTIFLVHPSYNGPIMLRGTGNSAAFYVNRNNISERPVAIILNFSNPTATSAASFTQQSSGNLAFQTEIPTFSPPIEINLGLDQEQQSETYFDVFPVYTYSADDLSPRGLYEAITEAIAYAQDVVLYRDIYTQRSAPVDGYYWDMDVNNTKEVYYLTSCSQDYSDPETCYFKFFTCYYNDSNILIMKALNLTGHGFDENTGTYPQTITITDISPSSLYLPFSGGTMTGAITLANTDTPILSTGNDAGWFMNKYGSITHKRSNTNDYVGIIGYNVTGDIRFYFDSGNITTNGYINASNGVYATNGTLVSRAATPQLHFQNASAQDIGGMYASSNRVYIRERPSAGSSYVTDIVFPAAKSNGNENVYVYTSRNFSLSGTTLTITVPS